MNAEPAFDQTLAAARAGDGRAFENLYDLLNRRVYSFVSIRGASDPEGMVNDIFLKVFLNLGDFAGNEFQFSAWVFKIARNTLIDEARRRQRRVDETDLDNAHEPAAGDVESDAIDELGNDWVVRQLHVLTSEQRDVVVLRIVSDLTIEAIAEILGKRVGAVKAIQRRAFRSLARNLDDRAVPR